jgi:hypothetical protein
MWQKISKVVKAIFFGFYLFLVMCVFIVHGLAYPMLKSRYNRTKNREHHPNFVLWVSFDFVRKLFGFFIS